MTADEALATVPTPIIVGINRYAVQIVDIIDDDPQCRAIIEPDLQIIKLARSHVTATLVVGSLLHELLHAIWEDKNLPNKPHEERVVIALETGMVALLADNPKLMTWIKRGLKR